MIKKDIENFLKNEERVANYRLGLSQLKKSGIFELLRILGLPAVVGDGSNTAAQAHQGSWSNGFHTALHVLEDFIELHDKNDPGTIRLTPDYGGTQAALKAGYLTKKDLEDRK